MPLEWDKKNEYSWEYRFTWGHILHTCPPVVSSHALQKTIFFFNSPANLNSQCRFLSQTDSGALTGFFFSVYEALTGFFFNASHFSSFFPPPSFWSLPHWCLSENPISSSKGREENTSFCFGTFWWLSLTCFIPFLGDRYCMRHRKKVPCTKMPSMVYFQG